MLEHTIGGRGRAYRDAGATLAAIARDVERHGADHLLLTGDLTGYATATEFHMAREALGAVADSAATCSVVPGNHDYITAGAIRDRRFEGSFGHLLQSDLPEYSGGDGYPFVHLKGDDVAIVGLCSAIPPSVPGLALGKLGTAQLDRLAALVDDARIRHRMVLVMVHHAPLAASGGRDSRTHGLIDGDALLRLLPGPRFAVLHGHLHSRFHHAASATRPHLFCAGSSTQRGHEGYWLIDVDDGRLRDASIHIPPRVIIS
jgi:3',5'-cyclic AMP phosphodiesterase CpdA